MRKTLFIGTAFVLASTLHAFAGDPEIEQLKQMIQQMRSELQEIKSENQKLKEEIRKLKEEKTAVAKGASFKSKTGKKVDFYGYFKIDAAYSDSKAVGKDYILFALPENSSNNNDNDFNLNFRHSRFGFNIRTKENDYDILGKFEFDFYGDYSGTDNPNKQGIRIRRAFIQIGKDDWSILAGQEWMLIAQFYPHLSNFPSGAFMGNIGYRIPQIRFTKLFKGESGTFKFQAAVDQEWGDASAPYWDTGSDSGMPDFQTRLTYDTNLGTAPFHIGVFGHVGREQVDLASGDKNLSSYSYGAECRVGLSNMFTLSGKIWKGRNVDGWYTGGIGQGVRYEYAGGTYDTKLTGTPVDAEEIDAVGGWVELTARLTNKLTWRIGAGVDNPDNDDLKGVAAARLKNTMYYTNAFYKLTPSIGLMGEYLRVETDYPSPLDDGTVNRFQGSILYFF